MAEKKLSKKANKAIVRRFNDEVWSQGNLDAVDEIVAGDLVWHYTHISGIESFIQNLVAFRTDFPDLRVTTDDLVAQGDKVAVRMTAVGTHEPTGKQATWTAMGLLCITDGKISEIWVNEDYYSRLQQVGLVPTVPD